MSTSIPTIGEIVAALRAALPPTSAKKFGAKGCTFFYRGPGIQSKRWNINGARVLDLLSVGRQSILPPSIHPESEMPYRWIGPDALDYVAPSALPLLTSSVAELISAALTPFGYQADAERPPITSINVDPSNVSMCRQLNDDALANLDAWVPILNLYGCQRTRKGYRAVATWRPSNTGQPPQRRKLNLHITPIGINDFGDGPKKYTAIDLVCAAKGCDWPAAYSELSAALGHGSDVTIALRLGEK